MFPMQRSNTQQSDIALTQCSTTDQIDKSQSLCLLQCTIVADRWRMTRKFTDSLTPRRRPFWAARRLAKPCSLRSAPREFR